MNNDKLHSLVGALFRRQKASDEKYGKLLAKFEDFVQACEEQPRSVAEEIDSIPGRRIFYHLTQRQDFTIAQNTLRGNALSFLVSQDGPFIMTHYPLVLWKPNLPALATNFGRWRPVTSWPLPDQVLDTDIIDLSYEFVDGGSQRNFNNQVAGPIFSRPDNFVPLPVPTVFAPNATPQFFPTFENILFDTTPAEPTTQGQLVVSLIGYRIANL